VDIWNVLVHALTQETRRRLGEIGIEVKDVSKRTKRVEFSEIAKSTKHRHKDNLQLIFLSYVKDVAAKVFLSSYITTAEVWVAKVDTMELAWGLTIDPQVIPPSVRLDFAIDTARESICKDSNDEASKVAKVLLMKNAVQAAAIDPDSKGCVRSLSASFGSGKKIVRKVVAEAKTDKKVEEILSRQQRKSVHDTDWPEKVSDFCMTKPIC
jgi:hypothetical protein